MIGGIRIKYLKRKTNQPKLELKQGQKKLSPAISSSVHINHKSLTFIKRQGRSVSKNISKSGPKF